MDFDSTLENDSRLRAELGGLLKIALNLPLKNSSFHKIICKLCKESDFQIYRYKCLICEDYNLCGDCFEKKQQDTEHKLEHPVVRFETPNELFGLKFDDTEINLLNFIELFQTTRHSGFKCDGCLMNPIQGIRFKCDQCHEFDLCLDCYWDKKSTLKHSYSQHTLIALGKNANLEIDPSNIELLRELGSGAFGSVYKSRLRNLNKIVACKIIQIDKLNNNNNSQDKTVLYESYLHELNAYKELKGVNILKMFGHCVEKVNNTKSNLMIITEFMSRGSLTTLLNNDPNITYRRRLQIATDIACGMARIHEHGFIHRDIRADNILIAEDFTAKIGDMGIAKLIENNKNTMIGCRPFMPPEFYTGKYDQKLDVFTFGLTLNELFGGSHYFNHPIRIKVQAPVGIRMITGCVNHDPVKRPTSEKIKKTIKAYRRVIDESFQKQFPNYKEMSLSRKNETFLKFYLHLEKIDF